VPDAVANGVRLTYEVTGEGDPVLLVCGTGQPAVSWQIMQVPALAAAGYKVVTFDNRGMPPSACPAGPYSVPEMVADTAGLIEALDLAPCRVAGLSLGAFITQELALARPDLVRGAVMMGTAGRQNAFLRAKVASWIELDESAVELPRLYDTLSTMPSLFSPFALADDEQVQAFLAFSEASPRWEGPGVRGQHEADAAYDDRLESLAAITVPCMVIVFELDVLTHASLGREVATAIPGAKLVEIARTGHVGPLENPDEVNAALIGFFAGC
jgi:pimeloyl-ACP methyl ester carboxylesterase